MSDFLLPVLLLALCLPIFVHAMGKDADTMCLPYVKIDGCGCKMEMGPKGCISMPANKQLCECHDTTNGGVTSGICMQTFHCEGKTAGGQGVDQGLSKLGEMLGKLMEALKGGGGGGGGGAPPPTTPTTGCQGTQYQTSDVSKLTDPCAQYVAPGTPIDFPTSTSTCDALSQSLGTCGGSSNNCPSVTVDCGDGYVQAPQSGKDANNCPLPNQCVLPDTTRNTPAGGVSVLCSASKRLLGLCGGGPNLSGLGSSTGLVGGMTGNIFLQNNGATIVANSLNPGNNTSVAGFYGSNTLGNGQPQGIAASMCQNRPWRGGVLGIIPASFFDGLCRWQGYQVGTSTSQTAPTVQVQQTTHTSTPSRPSTATTTAATSTPPGKVQIWAVPASVPLNTRTSIFWSTSGVTQCTETSPDGSFNQSSLSGGAATVPILGATTFTISCIDSAGNPVTGFVTVNLSI